MNPPSPEPTPQEQWMEERHIKVDKAVEDLSVTIPLLTWQEKFDSLFTDHGEPWDWNDVKSFITTQIELARREERERIKGKVRKLKVLEADIGECDVDALDRQAVLNILEPTITED